ncbi:Translation protein, beta-barrel domain [Pseudocohnilembus persalinus]|uniref:protein-synthesizing GTPase n=1 Tax=Pseudocohnilembus persalinus TaxID=266149 RepID=A0A0V0R980_PSEPJ|nr:Translation protein, beta-barrel domain [Pseudocohnilembus persalinus]|eukprot:KRX11052.1 Translation protein, beta-barrel domain [Pseudocohnilembus persalinus]
MSTTHHLNDEEINKIMAQQPQLKTQHYNDIDSLTPLSPQVISRQATLNIGTIGHVAHGKSTLVKAISGVHTVKFQKEKARNTTIRLGYANTKIFKCPKCPKPQCYKAFTSQMKDDPVCDNCQTVLDLVRQISFVDCPGHDILMSTMLTGAAVMDAAILLVAGNMECPQPQTYEHLRAIQIMKLQNILIVQNKVDIIFNEEGAAQKNFEQIKKFIKDFLDYNPPVIPCSAQLGYNVDAVIQYIVEYFPTPSRDLKCSPFMSIIRSFDVNKPGEEASNLKGGVVGGSILRGVLKVGDEVEIRPGRVENKDGKLVKCTPIKSRIVSLFAEQNNLLYAVPGGLIGVGLMLDPSITRNDQLVGNCLGYANSLPDVFIEIEVEFFLMRKLIIRQEQTSTKISKITKLETLKFNVGSNQTQGRVTSTKDDMMTVQLNDPICSSIGEKVAFCRRIDSKFRLIGWGTIKSGKLFKNQE